MFSKETEPNLEADLSAKALVERSVADFDGVSGGAASAQERVLKGLGAMTVGGDDVGDRVNRH